MSLGRSDCSFMAAFLRAAYPCGEPGGLFHLNTANRGRQGIRDTDRAERAINESMSNDVWERLTSGGLFVIAGPCVIESGGHALKLGRAVAAAAAAAGLPAVFKAFVRQGKPHARGCVPRTGTARGAAHTERGETRDRAARADRRSRDAAGRSRGRGLRRRADSGLSLPPDRSARCRRQERPDRQHQEGAVPRAGGHALRRRQGRFDGNGKILLTERGSSFGYRNLVWTSAG